MVPRKVVERRKGGRKRGREGAMEGGRCTVSLLLTRMPYASDGLRVGLRHKSQRPVMGLLARGNEAV